MRTLRVENGHRGVRQRHQRKAHRHSVVVIGSDPGGGQFGRRRDRQIILAFGHDRAHFAQLGGHRRQPVGLFDPPVGNVAQGGGAAAGE